MSAPIKVKAGRPGAFEVSPGMIGDSITFVPENGTLAPSLDAERLRRDADDGGQEGRAEEAEGRHRHDWSTASRRWSPAVNGTGVAADDLEKAVEPVLTKKGDRSAPCRSS